MPPAQAERLAALGQPAVSASGRSTSSARRGGRAAPGLAPLAVTVDLIQPTGSRTYATFRLDGSEVVAELQAHDVERPGEQLTLHADMNRAVVIDPATERVL